MKIEDEKTRFQRNQRYTEVQLYYAYIFPKGIRHIYDFSLFLIGSSQKLFFVRGGVTATNSLYWYRFASAIIRPVDVPLLRLYNVKYYTRTHTNTPLFLVSRTYHYPKVTRVLLWAYLGKRVHWAGMEPSRWLISSAGHRILRDTTLYPCPGLRRKTITAQWRRRPRSIIQRACCSFFWSCFT